MPEQYTEVTRKGYGTRIGESITGILFGLILFFYCLFRPYFLE